MKMVDAKYDMLGSLITTTTTPWSTPANTQGTTALAASTTTTTTTTTPILPILPNESTIAINVFDRYATLEGFLHRFAPGSLALDKSATLFYLPFAILGLTVSATIFFNWNDNSPRNDGNTNYGGSLWLQYREKKGGQVILRLLGWLCCLLLLQSCLVVILDLDGAWEIALLTFVRASCPLVHGLETSNRVLVGLTVLFLGWKAYAISRLPLLDCHGLESLGTDRFLHACCERWLQPYQAIIAIILLSLLAGFSGIHFWEVNSFEGSDSIPRIRCVITGGYKSAINFQITETPQLYQWILNGAVFLPISLASLVCSLVLWRRLLTNASRMELSGSSVTVWSPRVACQVQLVATVCGLYGLATLSNAAICLLAVMTNPGPYDLPDQEIELDPAWRRTIQYVTTATVFHEIADALTTSLLPPAFVLSSKLFRRQLFHFLRLQPFPVPRVWVFCTPFQYPSIKELFWKKPKVRRQPRWSWGRGWRQSNSVSLSPEAPTDAFEVVEDPDVLDAIVDQHNNNNNNNINAYANGEMAVCSPTSCRSPRYAKHCPHTTTSTRWAASSKWSSGTDFL